MTRMTRTEGAVSTKDSRLFVQLSRHDAQDAMRLLNILASSLAQDIHPMNDRAALVDAARRSITRRKLRTAIFPDAIFGEPAWDMLLELYARGSDNEPDVQNLLAELSGIPTTTAIRWMDYLEEQQLIRRDVHPFNGQHPVIRLTEKAKAIMDCYFAQVISEEQ
jgi:DNA-binding MarR family transcriptional regulator